MSNDDFLKLFNYITERFDHMEKVLEKKAKSGDLQKALGLLDALAKRQATKIPSLAIHQIA